MMMIFSFGWIQIFILGHLKNFGPTVYAEYFDLESNLLILFGIFLDPPVWATPSGPLTHWLLVVQ